MKCDSSTTASLYESSQAMHCIIARARPAEVSEQMTLSGGSEIRCRIELSDLSPCSFACLSGTIYTSLWPHLCIKLRDGTSVRWLLDRVWIFRSDDVAAGMDMSIRLLSMFPIAV